MKFQFKKIIFIEFILFVFSFFNIYFDVNLNVYLIELLVLLPLISLLLKPDVKNSRYEKDIMLISIITIVTYYVLTYFAGFFIGFVYSTYSRRLVGILYNIITSLIQIYVFESLREKVVKSGKYYKIILIICPLIFTLLEIVPYTNLNTLASKYVLLQYILSIVIPCFVKNILLTYLMYYSGKLTTIVYQLFMIMPKYILGVFPDLGDYINTILLCILPVITMYIIYRIINFKDNKIENGRNIVFYKRVVNNIFIVNTIFIIVLIYLVSGFGRFYSMSIGSGSMSYTINKGDLIVIDKKKSNYKVKDIIAFKIDNKTVVHRIIKIEKNKDNETIYITKGDANNGPDNWVLRDSNIVGKYKFRIVFIGWPSVLLSELING